MKPASPKPICPKCGYDQSGEIATWQTQCPMNGVCPECGFGFAWAGIFDPRLTGLSWSVEHARGPRQMIRRTLPTLWYMLPPNRYWSRMRMDSARSMPRFVGWFAGVFLSLYILAACANIVVRYAYAHWDNAQLLKIKAGQSPQMQATIDAMMNDTTTLVFWGPVLGESLLFPFLTNRFYSYGYVEIVVGASVAGAGISLMWLVLMSAFPVTRKKVKLRVAHVARATVVGGLMPFIVVPLATIAEAIAFLISFTAQRVVWSRGEVPGWTEMALILSIIVWVQWFWVLAVRRGWQIKARWFEMVLVLIASFFGLVFAGLLLSVFAFLRTLIALWAEGMGI